MNLSKSLHHHQAAATKASLAGGENERQNPFEQITLYAQNLRKLRKREPELSRKSDA